MSLTFHEEIVHVRRVGRIYAMRILATCPQQVMHVVHSWNLENDTSRGQKGSTIHLSRPPADQSGKRVASWTEKLPDTLDTLVVSVSRCLSGVSTRMSRISRLCYEETAPVEFHLLRLDARPLEWPVYSLSGALGSGCSSASASATDTTRYVTLVGVAVWRRIIVFVTLTYNICICLIR